LTIEKKFINHKEVTMSDRDEFGAFLVGFIVGGLTGAVVALLFAPQSGEETRALIKDKSIELRDKAQLTAEEAIAAAEAMASDARARADELANQVRAMGKPKKAGETPVASAPGETPDATTATI
jgi:gas vesicle protein